jgi:hypothetical protein
MNAHLLFDKLAYVDRLKAAGVDDQQARAHAEGLEQAFREEVATKTDLIELETALRADILKLETSLRADILKLETSLRADIASNAQSLIKELHSTVYKGAGLIALAIAIIGFFITMSAKPIGQDLRGAVSNQLQQGPSPTPNEGKPPSAVPQK